VLLWIQLPTQRNSQLFYVIFLYLQQLGMKMLHKLSYATANLSKKISSFSEVAVSLLGTCTAPTSVQQVSSITEKKVKRGVNLRKIVKSNSPVLAFLLGSTLLSSTALKTDLAVAQSVIPPTYTTKLNPRQTFINADTGAVNSYILELKRLGIKPGDTLLLERFGYFSPFGDSRKEYTGTIFATFSTDNILQPNSGSFNGNTTDRVPGAINAQFPNGCSQSQCIGKIFYISRGQNLVQGGFNGILVQVPANAQYLFIGAADSTYGDNVDLNKDLGVGISKVLAQ